MLENRATFEKVVNEPEFIIYTSFEESKMSVISEIPCVDDLYPEDFIYFIQNWTSCAQKINPLIEEVK